MLQARGNAEVCLPVHSSVLEVVLDFLYEDRATKVDNCDDVEWICTCLSVADQLLMPRLFSVCEASLARLLSLKNCGEMLEFSSVFNARQLKKSCMQFICHNLPAVVEMR